MVLVSGAVALAYGLLLIQTPQSALRSVVKTFPVALLAIGAGWAGLWGLALALALCALGDWFLAHEGDSAFLAGLISFSLGHLGFVLLLLPLWQGAQGAASLVTLLIALSTLRWLLPYTGALRLPVLIYVALITAMGIMAWGQGDWALRLGASSFILSDLLLSMGLFRGVKGTERPLWFFYIIGQIGLCVGFLSVL